MRRCVLLAGFLLVAPLFSGCGWYFLQKDPTERLVGEKAPPFTLPAAFGENISLAGLQEKGNVVLVFYRGHW